MGKGRQQGGPRDELPSLPAGQRSYDPRSPRREEEERRRGRAPQQPGPRPDERYDPRSDPRARAEGPARATRPVNDEGADRHGPHYGKPDGYGAVANWPDAAPPSAPPRDWEDTSWRGGQERAAPPAPGPERYPDARRRGGRGASSGTRWHPYDDPYDPFDDYDGYGAQYDDEDGYGGAGSPHGRRAGRYDDAPQYPQAGRGRNQSPVGWWDTSRQWAVDQRERLLRRRGLRALWQRLAGTRRRTIILAVVACILLCAIGGTPVAFLRAAALARTGLQHIKNAETDLKLVQANPFDTKSIAAAHTELAAAHDDFSQIGSLIGWVPGIADVIPLAGSKLSGAQKLVPLAIEGTQAGMLACDALGTLATGLKDPLSQQAHGLSAAQVAGIQGDWAQVHALFGVMVGQLAALSPGDLALDPRLGPLVATFRAQLPQIQQGLESADAVVAALPALTGVGQPANYLLEVMDSTELRPGGGFIGNYGILTLTGGRLGQIHVQDVDLLDIATKAGTHMIPIPSQYSWLKSLYPIWSFRDSNLDADFPTAARNGESLFAQELPDIHQPPVPLQGVIAITPWLIENAMQQITGPLYIPQYKETVTWLPGPQNLINRIHYHALGNVQGSETQLDPQSGTSYRKAFTGYVFKAFMAKLQTDLSGNMSKLAKLVIDALHSKDIQVYFNQQSVENVLQRYGFAAAVQAPAQGDSVFEVDANIGANKANYILKYNLSDQITLDAAGTATHHLAISYTWPNDPNTIQEIYACYQCFNLRYHSYSRVYASPGATLLSQHGWVNQVPPTSAFGRKVFAGTTYDYFGTTATITLVWKVTNAASHDLTSWHYDLLFQKQAGITWPLTLSIQLPACAHTLGTPTGLAITGKSTVGVKEPLANDLHLSVDYSGC
jgi:hypothetical protein